MSDEQGKAMATLKARAALVGCELYCLDGDRYLLRRWGLTRELAGLEAVEALLLRLEGNR